MVTDVAIYQPRYYPRLHYVARAQQADVFIIYDDVQFSRRSRQHRAQIEFQGAEWLTIPVKHSGNETSIEDARIDMSSPWIPEHTETLFHKYGEAARPLHHFYHDLLPFIPSISSIRHSSETVRNHITDAGNPLLDAVRQYDSRWQAHERKLDELRATKDDLGRRISEAKADGEDREASRLIESSREVSRQISPLETAAEDWKERRDTALVELSEHVIGHASIERMSPCTMWELEGVNIEEIAEFPKLVELTVPLLLELLDRFDIDTTVVRSSNLPTQHPGDPSEYLARLTAAVGGERYISGREGYENYIDEESFAAENVEVTVQDWAPDWEDGNVCALDVLFNSRDPGQYVR